MKRLITKLILFGILNASIAAVLIAGTNARFSSFKQYETDSVLLSTPKHTNFGLLIMGTSRARLLTRIKCNWECLERELDRTVFNIAVPFGGGILPEKMYLTSFYQRGNSADTILFFLDAFTLFAPQPNLEHKFVHYEPFRPRFFIQLLENNIPLERIFIYMESKFSYRWFTQTPGVVECDPFRIEEDQIDPERVRRRNDSLYFEGLNETYFDQYAGVLEEILKMATLNNTHVVIAFPPTLIGEQPGMSILLDRLAEFRRYYEFEVHDFTNAIPEIALYSDYDHLNSEGVKRFVVDHLKPIL